jgi:sarcosine oxidase, subunit gamma
MDEPPIVASRRRSPLYNWLERFRQASHDIGNTVRLREIAFPTQINLRGDAGDPAFGNAVREFLKLDLPTRPNTWTASAPLSALWLGPDEWLLVGDADPTEPVISRLIDGLCGIHSSVVDVSDARAVVELAGTRSHELLAKGCSLDLHPRTFGPGDCAQTNLARANIILQQLDRAPTWLIYVRISFADYLAAWLVDAIVGIRERAS